MVEGALDAETGRDGQRDELGEVDEVLAHPPAPRLGATLQHRVGQQEPAGRGDEPEPDGCDGSESEGLRGREEREADQGTGELLALEQREPFIPPSSSVRRALALLEELNRQRINSVQHLHEVTALPKSTIVRLLENFGSSATWRTIHGRADTR